MNKKILVFVTTALLLMLVPAKATLARTLTVAVIDTGIDKGEANLCRFGHKSFLPSKNGVKDSALQDNHGHGTHIAGIINTNAGEGNYCLVSIKFYSESNPGWKNLANEMAAFRYAINIKVDFINLSGGGPERNPQEEALIKEALDKGITVVVAAGNEDADLNKECNYFPACYDKRLVVVGNLQENKAWVELANDPAWTQLAQLAGYGDKLGKVETSRSPSSNYGDVVNRWEVGTDVLSTLPGGQYGHMTGTSQATAVATGKLLKARLKK